MFYCSLMIALLCGLSVAYYPTCLGIYVIYMHDMLYIFVYCNQMSPCNKLHFLLNTNNKRIAHLRCMNSDNPCYSPFNHPPLTSVTNKPILAGQFSDCHSNNHYYYISPCTLQLYDCVYICMYTLCLLIWKPYLSHFELGMRAHIFKTIMHAIYIN